MKVTNTLVQQSAPCIFTCVPVVQEADIREEGQEVCPYTNDFVKYQLGDIEDRLWDQGIGARRRV